MAVVKIKFLDPTQMISMYRGIAKQPGTARVLLKEGYYDKESELFVVNGDSEDAAQEVFDLTNNPSRHDERQEKYGTGRSLSVGDIVVVGEDQWLCCSIGWQSI